MGELIKKRYAYKLASNLVGLLINMITQAIILRSLGPKAYGDFSFLTNFFAQVTGFLDMGTSTAFFTKLSQRPKDFGLVSFYMWFCGIVSLIILVLVVASHISGSYIWIWPQQGLLYIYLAGGLGIFTWLTHIISQMGDACGITVSAEKARIFQQFIGLSFILLLFITHQLGLTQFFIYNYLAYILLGASILWCLNKYNFISAQTWTLPTGQIRSYLREFYKYSSPLFSYSLFSLGTGLFDRWLLAVYSGRVEQGFYGLSYKVGAICFLFISPMTPLFMRGFAIAFDNKDLGGMTNLFRRYIPIFYSMAAFFSCFISVQAAKVIHILGGSEFNGALIAVAIMALYPMHQTYGQLSGSVFLATGKTVLYRNIGVIMMLIGLPFTYIMIAPKGHWGIGAGATGLAAKMVILNFIWVNVQLFFNAKFLGLRFFRYIGQQVLSAGFLFLLSLVSCKGMDYMFQFKGSILTNFIVSGVIYTTLTIAVIYYMPNIFGLRSDDLKLFLQKAIMVLDPTKLRKNS